MKNGKKEKIFKILAVVYQLLDNIFKTKLMENNI